MYRNTNELYELVPLNGVGRQQIPELDLEIGLHQGWVRYWYKGELLKQPEELQESIDQLMVQLQQMEKFTQEQQRRIAVAE